MLDRNKVYFIQYGTDDEMHWETHIWNKETLEWEVETGVEYAEYADDTELPWAEYLDGIPF